MQPLPPRFFVTGIGTGVGKTVTSAILAEALHADYWKPVQCGEPGQTDTILVQSLVSNPMSEFYTETYCFPTPSSPHYAAKQAGIEIDPHRFRIPESPHRLIIEGAGGLMVPLSEDYLVIDLIKHFEASVILVSKNYLGSINHTLMSLEALNHRGIKVAGIIFNGDNFFDNEEIIHRFTEVPVVGRIDFAAKVDAAFVAAQAAKMKLSLAETFTW